MKILIIKTSSLGDIIHALPALSDIKVAFPNSQVDWVVEEAFAEIPSWHKHIHKVIPVALRRWKKEFKLIEIKSFFKKLRAEKYDCVIDAQGLVKSAVITRMTRAILRSGFDRQSAREPMASFFYQKGASVTPHQAAISQIRQLFSQILDYPYLDSAPKFEIDLNRLPKNQNLINKEPYWLFLHGTANETKAWPIEKWSKLIALSEKKIRKIYLPWGNEAERKRAEQLADWHESVEVLPKLKLGELAGLILSAKAVIGLDSGLSHLSAALGVPTLGVYKASDPRRFCITGPRQDYIEVIHEPNCKNAHFSKIEVGAYDACDCSKGVEAEKILGEISNLTIG